MILPTNAEQGGLNAGELLQLYQDPKSKEYVAKIVQATGRGFSLANTAIARRGQSPLYCQPNNLVLTGEQIIDIIYRFVEINGEGYVGGGHAQGAGEPLPMPLSDHQERKFP